MTAGTEETPTSALVQWPESARINRVVPKRSLSSAASTPTAMRRTLAEDVDQVRWLFTLSPALTPLLGTAEVPEFVVIGIDLRTEDLAPTTVAALDRSMPRRVIFELSRTVDDRREQRMAAVLSAGGPAGRGQYLASPWFPAGAPREPLPAAIDLEALYLAALEPLLPASRASAARVSEVAGRIEAATALDRKITALEGRVRREVQFNRRLALRQQLRELQRQRDALS